MCIYLGEKNGIIPILQTRTLRPRDSYPTISVKNNEVTSSQWTKVPLKCRGKHVTFYLSPKV